MTLTPLFVGIKVVAQQQDWENKRYLPLPPLKEEWKRPFLEKIYTPNRFEAFSKEECEFIYKALMHYTVQGLFRDGADYKEHNADQSIADVRRRETKQYRAELVRHVYGVSLKERKRQKLKEESKRWYKNHPVWMLDGDKVVRRKEVTQ